MEFEVSNVSGELEARGDGDSFPRGNVTEYVSRSVGDELVYEVDGSLTMDSVLSYRLYADTEYSPRFRIGIVNRADDDGLSIPYLSSGEDDPRAEFYSVYFVLPRYWTQVTLPIRSLHDGNRFLEKEGAVSRKLTGGDRIDPERIDEVRIRVYNKGRSDLTWYQTPLSVSEGHPADHNELIDRDHYVDELGQSNVKDWDGKTDDIDELSERLTRQSDLPNSGGSASSFSKWGGWTERTVEATGFFRTHHDGDRWWLVDPDGHPFWSTGMNAVSPRVAAPADELRDDIAAVDGEPDGEEETDEINLLARNFRRVFGEGFWKDEWEAATEGVLRTSGINTVGAFSDLGSARSMALPYVRVLDFEFSETLYRDFPDVFAASFEEDAKRGARALAATEDDPALLGYFLQNEPNWSFIDSLPAEEMLHNTTACATRREFAEFLAERYGIDGDLAAAWGADVTVDAIAEGGDIPAEPSETARADLEAFSEVMVTKLYSTLSAECRAVDDNHLNLGIRAVTPPEPWMYEGMKTFDVFSMNWYEKSIDQLPGDRISSALSLPILVGEWSFGALDAGPPAPGLCHVGDQESRGEFYRQYVENAASKPWCVGAHYYKLYDDPAIGAFSGEPHNVGFLDVCNRQYEPLTEAARASGDRIPEIHAGTRDPFSRDGDQFFRRW
ncbi:hypothetical protein [Halosimplex marinum]|uniref:hypothetical protein n=1 Tax=Halosimplex marinum TaxID=3396620 RepID=UPI003F565300